MDLHSQNQQKIWISLGYPSTAVKEYVLSEVLSTSFGGSACGFNCVLVLFVLRYYWSCYHAVLIVMFIVIAWAV